MNLLLKIFAVMVVLISLGVPSVCQIPTATPNPDAWRLDLDGDGQIDSQDFFLFREFWHTQNIATPTPTGTPTSTFTPSMTPTQEEIPPYVSSTPPRFALVGELLLYPIVAVDPNGDSITFAPVTVPAGMTVSATGLVAWTPTQAGKVDVSIGLSDGKNPQVLHEFTVHVGVVETEVSGVVTVTGGGTVEVNDPSSPIDGTRIYIPPGTLTQDATVTIRSVSNPEEFFAGALPVELQGFGITEMGITVEVPYEDSLLSTFGITVEDLRVYFLDPATGEWIELPAILGKRRKDNPPGGFMMVQLPPMDMRTAGTTPQVYVGSRPVYAMKQQPQRLVSLKGSVEDFFDTSRPRKRLLFLHGLTGSPDDYKGANDYFAQEPSPSNTVSPALFAFYDSIVGYQYRSGNAIANNADLLAGEIERRYYSGAVYQPGGVGPGIALYRIDRDPSFKFDILSHSMGGLVARWMLEKATLGAGAKLSGNLGRLITSGTPHGGAVQVNVLRYVFGPLADVVLLTGFRGVEDMEVGSQFLRSLNEDQLSADTFAPSGSNRYYCLAGLTDWIVPPSSDRVVTTQNALFLSIARTRERLFGDDESRGNDGLNFEHIQLHERAATNGVGQQVLDWLLTTPAPTRTPTPAPPPFAGNELIVEIPGLPDNVVQLEMVRIPAGSFLMGVPPDPGNPALPGERGAGTNEMPQHEVIIQEDFYLSKYEVTVAQWRYIVGTNPSYAPGDNYPAAGVSWNDITSTFIRYLNQYHHTNKFRLPSEAEWEYAVRGGPLVSEYSPRERFHFGPSFGCDDDCGACPERNQYMWWCGNSGSQIHPVGMLNPNQLGLFDMHGNVWEWCEDWYHPSYSEAPTDGSAWFAQQDNYPYRVNRGGCWGDVARSCRSAGRNYNDPDSRSGYLGFRLARTP